MANNVILQRVYYICDYRIHQAAIFLCCRTLGSCLDDKSHCYTLEVSFYSYMVTTSSQALPYTEEACILYSLCKVFVLHRLITCQAKD